MKTAVAGCSGIRVWRGYKSDEFSSKDKHSEFLKKLGQVFIPATAQLLYPLGLKAYFPSIVNLDSIWLPDEIALVVYDSPDAYEASKKTTVGKAYGLLHQTVFKSWKNKDKLPHSISGFPEIWSGKIKEGTPVYFFDNSIDWHSGKLKVSYAMVSSLLTPQNLGEIIKKWVNTYSTDSQIDNIILVLEHGYIICWEHMKEESSDSFVKALSSYLNNIDTVHFETAYANQLFAHEDTGFEVYNSTALDVRIENIPSI